MGEMAQPGWGIFRKMEGAIGINVENMRVWAVGTKVAKFIVGGFYHHKFN
jgi:hypothetical protein